MGVRYKDYYETLGVSRTATQDEIQKAFRKLARQHHPDINKSPGAEAKFKELNEAYEVLKQPEKRKRYDTLGSNWQNGQDFTPPPGWQDIGGGFRSGGPRGFDGFSDFFESMFGPGAGAAARGGGRRHAGRLPRGGSDAEVEIELTLEEAVRGGAKPIELEMRDHGGRTSLRKLEFTIPPGVMDGTKIRLENQGGQGSEGGPPGDLFLKVRLQEHTRFRVKEFDLECDVSLTPWEAALGGGVAIETLDGTVTLTIPPLVSSGQRLRLARKGLRRRDGERGNLHARILIVMPRTLTDEERVLFERLAKTSSFRPRD